MNKPKMQNAASSDRSLSMNQPVSRTPINENTIAAIITVGAGGAGGLIILLSCSNRS